MKAIVFICGLLCLMSCNQKQDIVLLKEFDNYIRGYDRLEELNLHTINGVLFKDHFEADSITSSLYERLPEFGLNEETYEQLKDGMNRNGMSSYIRLNDCSIYVSGGSFARIFGILINHGGRFRNGDRIEVRGRVHFNVGDMIEQDVFPVWTD